MLKRKSTSLYGTALKKAIEMDEPWLQSQDLPKYLPFYVDRGQLSAIQNNSSELIVGRRGTGKTHLLGSLKEIIDTKTDEIAIFISILECSQTPPIPGGETTEFASKRIAREMFGSFLREYLYKFSNTTDKLLSRLEATKEKKEHKILSEKVREKFGFLLQAIEIGKKHSVSRRSKEKIKRSSSNEKGMKGGGGLGISGRGVSGSVDFNIAGGMRRDYSSVEEIDIESTFHIDMKEVRTITEEILELLNVKRLYILIDEWMELEKVTPSKVQPTFAQMLKITFFNSKNIAVKIASIWSNTTLYDRQDMSKSIGIQLGHDIIRGPDLDIDFIEHEDEVFEFCKEMLFRRLAFVCKEIEAIQGRDQIVDDIFIVELFDNRKNFNAFIAATHGIPRQLMQLFNKCAKKLSGNFAEYAIDYTLVASIASTIYREQKRKAIDPTSSAHILLSRISRYMETKNRRTFLVKSSSASNSSALRKLIDEEHIHQIPSALTPRRIRDDYKAFHIDFGNYADWVMSRNDDHISLSSISVMPFFDTGIESCLEDWVIDIAELDESIIDCKTCGYAFLDSNAVYVKAHICPKCATDIKSEPSLIQMNEQT